jgi:hypothetical protein
MSLTHELAALVQAYLAGHTPLEAIREWLARHAQDIIDAQDSQLDELDGELWLLISEMDRGDLDADQVRAELTRFVSEQKLTAALSSADAHATGSDSDSPTSIPPLRSAS